MQRSTLPSLAEPSSSTSHRLKLLEGKRAGTLVVHEIYRSLQGESTFAGLPCVFVRLSVCHLRCRYCDTPHAFHSGEVASIDDVYEKVTSLARPGDLIELTGGEPLLQPEAFPLMTRLADAGWEILLETSGACDIEPVDPRIRVILDIKTPGSGEVEANLWSNLSRLGARDEVKFVVCDRDDFDWAIDRVHEHGLIGRCPVLMSASYGQVEPHDLAAWILETGLPLRQQIQVHKLLWGPKTRGV